MDKKEIILSTIAGLAVTFVGYVVWRHEQVISADNAQAQQDANQAQIDELNNAIASLPSAASYGGGASQQSYFGTNVPDTGSTSLQSPGSYSSDLNAILSSFYPATTTPTAAANTSTPGNSTTPSTPASTPTNTDLASYITSQLNTGTANQTYNTVLPTSLTNYVAPVAASIYSTPVSNNYATVSDTSPWMTPLQYQQLGGTVSAPVGGQNIQPVGGGRNWYVASL